MRHLYPLPSAWKSTLLKRCSCFLKSSSPLRNISLTSQSKRSVSFFFSFMKKGPLFNSFSYCKIYMPFHNKTIPHETLSAYLESNIEMVLNLIVLFFGNICTMIRNFKRNDGEYLWNLLTIDLLFSVNGLLILSIHHPFVFIIVLLCLNQVASSTNSQWNNIPGGLLLWVLH